VKQLSQIQKALHKATQETTHYMTAHVQEEARTAGWPDHLVNNLRVTHDNDGFNTVVDESLHSEALDWEYGTPGRQPTAAIRRVNNQMGQANEFLLGRLSEHVGEL